MTPFFERSPFSRPETLQSVTFEEYSVQRLRLLSGTFDRITRILGQDTQYQQYQYVLTSLCREPAIEQQIIEEIDMRTRQETIETLQGGKLECLVVGTGPAGVSLSSKLRQLYPSVHVWMVDDRGFRGGQFADEGYNFKLNTPKKGPIGFAKELPDPNNLGDAAYLQISDISGDEEDYFRRKKLATCLKVDGYIAAPALVGVKVLSVERPTDHPYTVITLHKETGQEVLFYPNVVVFARGRGKPKFGVDLTSPDTRETLVTRGDRIFVSEEFNKHIDTSSPEEILQEINNGLAMIGAGDSTNTALEAILIKLLKILSPAEIQQLGIDVYGAKYGADVQQFREDVRIPRYDALQPYIGNFIRPNKVKATDLLTVGKRSIGIKTSASLWIYGTVAMMTGYQNPPIENTVRIAGARVIDVMGNNELDGEVIAQQIEGENIFTIGIDMRENFPGRPPVFARSIARYTPRILATAERIVEILQHNTEV